MFRSKSTDRKKTKQTNRKKTRASNYSFLICYTIQL